MRRPQKYDQIQGRGRRRARHYVLLSIQYKRAGWNKRAGWADFFVYYMKKREYGVKFFVYYMKKCEHREQNLQKQ